MNWWVATVGPTTVTHKSNAACTSGVLALKNEG